MKRNELDSIIIAILREFCAECAATGQPPFLSSFCSVFEKRMRKTLKAALQEVAFDTSVKKYLQTIEELEFSDHNLQVCVHLRGCQPCPAKNVLVAPVRKGDVSARVPCGSKAGAKRRRGSRTPWKPVSSAIKRLFSHDLNGQVNYLPLLPPSSKWTVLVDETGCDFEPGATSCSRGRMVALFVPDGTLLPALPGKWHAVDLMKKGFGDQVVEAAGRLLSLKCGLLGISAKEMPESTTPDQRLSCLADLLSLGFRLLPVDGPTEVSLFVEQFGGVDDNLGKALLRSMLEGVLHNLASVFPNRAKWISAKGKVIAKDGHPWNGYVDAAAYIWGAQSMSKFRSRVHWSGTCFLEDDSADALRRVLDAFQTEGAPDASDWTMLLSMPEADDPASLVSAFLRAVGEESRADMDLWHGFMAETRRHLDSKAIDMGLLCRQIRWLKDWMPSGVALPPRTRLMWLTTELAAGNHAGRTCVHDAATFRKEFDELVARLYREDCPLVAHANLHLAVAYTNAFEFEKARALLRPMREWPVEGMGLRMEGRLLSSLGQHEAFLGNQAEALALFDEAISLFRELSEESFPEIAQTGAYAATVAMDAKTPDADERLASYLWGGPFSEEKFAAEASRLSTSSKPGEKYAHHILLRRLVELPENHPARAAYLSQKSNWAEPPIGHPWELIEFYRAQLLPVGDEREERLDTAYELALADGGPTLQVIAAVIQGTGFCGDGAVDQKSYCSLVDNCAEALPAIGTTRLAALRGQLDPATRLAPLDLARAVLPFNFR